MMNKLLLLLSLLLVTNHFVTAYDSKRIVKIVYRPYGPLMCREVCNDSIDSCIYKKEDLSCSRISRNDSNNVAHCLKGDTRTSSPGNHQSCDSFCKVDAGREALKQLSKLAGGLHHNYTRDLHKACKEGNLCLVNVIVSKRLVDINCRDVTGKTPVMTAVLYGHIAVFDFLVRVGCDLTARDNSHNNILHIACALGNLDIVKELIVSHNYDIDSTGWHRLTPVMYASRYGHTEVVALLLRKGCYPAKHNTNQNILHIACRYGQADTVKYILNHNIVNIDCRGTLGRTPVMLAAYMGHKGVVDLLISKNCNATATDDEGNNLLHESCIGSNVSMVKHILELDIVSINSRGYNGRTPMMTAAKFGQIEVFELLVSRNANVSITDYDNNNIMHMACIGGNVSVVKHILKLGIADIDSRGNHWRTPVMLAASKGHRSIVDFLISKNCNVTVTDGDGNNILFAAIASGVIEMVKYVIGQNLVDVNGRGFKGRTPVMEAALYGHKDIVDFLLSQKCDMKATDDDGNNILHLSCLMGNVGMVEHILNLDIVSIDIRGTVGRTPVMTAADSGQKEIVELLVRRNCNVTATDDKKNNILHVACIGGNLNTLRYILKLNVIDRDSRGQYNRTPVMFAAICGHGVIVDLLVSKNCNFMAADVYGNNILHMACSHGRTYVVKNILEQNLLGVNSRGQYGRTPIMLAVFRGHNKVVALLISRNCDLEAVDFHGNNILHMACKVGNIAIVHQILELDIVRLKGKNKSGLTPGKLAEKKGYRSIVSLLRANKYW